MADINQLLVRIYEKDSIRIFKALERIADSLEILASPPSELGEEVFVGIELKDEFKES